MAWFVRPCKEVRNMNKLILFRQFYVMVVAYIYFTRIVVYLLKSTAGRPTLYTVSPQLEHLREGRKG